jgi:L-fuconolactonase
MTIVDTHHHLWDLSVRDQPWLSTQAALAPLRRTFTLADLEPAARAAGVSSTVLVQTVTDPAETPEMLALAATAGLVAGVVGWVDLTAPDVADALGALRAGVGGSYLAGLRHPVLIEPDLAWLVRPEVLRGLAAVAAAGLVYDVVSRPAQLPAAIAAAAAVPELTFVLDHLGNPEVAATVDEPWSRALRELAALPNTACKLSGILGEPPPEPPDRGRPAASVAHIRPYYEVALNSFGPDRMMFGSDWPVSTIGAPYAQVVAAARLLTADLSPADGAAIFSGTAQRVYGLGDRGHREE